jgi:hypothetical protein
MEVERFKDCETGIVKYVLTSLSLSKLSQPLVFRHVSCGEVAVLTKKHGEWQSVMEEGAGFP